METRCEARLWRGSDRVEQRAAVLHEDWCRAARRPTRWEQLTPECQATWVSVATGRPVQPLVRRFVRDRSMA